MATDEKKRPVITLIGLKQAREGNAFIHQGPSSHCQECEYYRVCIENLETGRIYEIVKLRERKFQCKLNEAEVRVVEVTKSDIKGTVLSKLAIEGATINFESKECDIQTCNNYEICFPQGLIEGDRCIISRVGKKVNCPKRWELVEVVLSFFPGS